MASSGEPAQSAGVTSLPQAPGTRPRVRAHPAQVALLPAGLGRRLMALAYDAVIVFAILFFATLPLVVVAGHPPESGARLPYQAYLLVWMFLYAGGSWTHGGQTIGMKAWRLQARGARGSALSWGEALVRFGFGLVSGLAFGAGYLWVLVEPERRTWHERVSGTWTVVLPRRPPGRSPEGGSAERADEAPSGMGPAPGRAPGAPP